MTILGIDPGYAIVGFGAVEYKGNKFKTLNFGTIKTKADENMLTRFKTAHDELASIIKLIKPDVVAVEELFFNTNTKTAINVAQCRGVLLLAALNAGAEAREYTPLQIKQAVTGYGRADKQQMQQMIKMLLNLESIPKPDDAADALGVAICAAHSYPKNL